MCDILSVFTNSERVAFRRELKVCTAKIIYRILFGVQSDVAGERIEAFGEAMEGINKTAGKLDPGQFFPAVRWMDLRGVERDLKEDMSVVQSFLQAAIADRRATATADRQRTIADILLLQNQGGQISGLELMAVIFVEYPSASGTMTSGKQLLQ